MDQYAESPLPNPVRSGISPTESQRRWLQRGLGQPGGKLPLFDGLGQKINERTVSSCIERGWAVPWFNNPLKPDWLVCKLTDAGRRTLEIDIDAKPRS